MASQRQMVFSENRITGDYEITAQQSNCAKEPAGSILKYHSPMEQTDIVC
jgi:hypothetical protein